MKPVVKRCWYWNKGCRKILVGSRWYNADKIKLEVSEKWSGTIQIEGNKLDVTVNGFAFCSEHPVSLLVKEREEKKRKEKLRGK